VSWNLNEFSEFGLKDLIKRLAKLLDQDILSSANLILLKQIRTIVISDSFDRNSEIFLAGRKKKKEKY